jgi:anaphase-promoting complex subunit 3
MEMLEFTKAEQTFLEMIRLEPYRLEGLDNYSTCLWRLKKQVELCQLSNRALIKNLFAPETWVIVGNSYSAQNEHEAAIKFFKRAIQINP